MRDTEALLAGVGGLVVLDVAGGVVAVAADVNTPAEAWSSRALLAAPWPMVVGQVALAVGAHRLAGTPRRVAAGLLSAACLASAASGFFDGGLGNEKVPARLAPLQWTLVGATAVVGALAGRVALQGRTALTGLV
ncbi:MAG TPA: hypothetical protein VFV40_06925 [Nocardioides sp.]|nr:hypothetical protein [Nocardioides sp.]